MKRNRINKLLCLALCAALATALCIPCALAGAASIATCEGDREKLCAFWQQEAYSGLTNGEAVYDHDWPNIEGFEPPAYDGSWNTLLINQNIADGYCFDFRAEFPINGYYDGEYFEILEQLYPDLYGALVLTDSAELIAVGSQAARPDQTHIESIDVSGGSRLETVQFCDQPLCTSVRALECPLLRCFDVTGCPCSELAFSPKSFEQPVSLLTFGGGAVGAVYTEQSGTAVISAYPENGEFIGWFGENGLVSAETTMELTEGCSLRACFGGDMDGDGDITVSDAVVALRVAMGLAEASNEPMADVNGNGGTDIADAVLILRFAMRLI